MVATRQVEQDNTESFVINSVVFDAPWNWLAAGWRDLTATPVLSLSYGAIFALVSIGLAYGMTQIGWQSVVIAMAGGS